MRTLSPNSTDKSVMLTAADADGNPVAMTAATPGLSLVYQRHAKVAQAITVVHLASVEDPHTDGGLIHLGDGYHRLDVPDAAFAEGVDAVLIRGSATGITIIGEMVAIGRADVGFWLGSGVSKSGQGQTAFPDVSVKLWSGNNVAFVFDGSAAYPKVHVRGYESGQSPAEQVDAPFAGTGAHEVTITVTDDTPLGLAQELQGATVRLAEGVNNYERLTDANGETVLPDGPFNLDPATYAVTITKNGYDFAGGTITVASDPATHTKTFAMTTLNVTPSVDPLTTNAFGTYRSAAGKAAGRLRMAFRLVDRVTPQGGYIFSESPVHASADASGLIEAELLRLSRYVALVNDKEVGRFTTSGEATFALPEMISPPTR